MFPEQFTEFIKKINAQWDGDPIGDYVMAEDVNEIQEAIERLERFLGISSDKNNSLISRIKALEKLIALKVPSSIFVNDTNLSANTTNSIEKLSAFNLISYKDNNQNLILINQELVLRGKEIFGQIDSKLDLNIIQEKIGHWKSQNVTGIHILDLGSNTSSRSKENQILNSIVENNLKIMIETSDWNKLLNNIIVPIYNPDGKELNIPKESITISKEFAYYDRQFYGDEVDNKIYKLLELKKNKDTRILGIGKSNNQTQYSYIQSYGLLYSLDFIYDGLDTGTLLSNQNNFYSWPTFIGDWKSKNPTIFHEFDYLYRTIPNGRIVINKDMTTSLDGYTINSEMINWINNTVPGNAIKDYSMPPTKLSTYDVDRILELINSTGTVLIKPEMIEQSESGNLPINIPSSNMRVNVILAVNQHNDADSTEENQILDAGIKNLNAIKLFGHIEKERMTKNVVLALNSSSEKINVKDATIETLNSSVVVTEILNSTQATIDRLNVTTNITTVDMTSSGFITAKDGSFQKLYVVDLTAENMKVDSLKVKSLEADNISSLILDTIEANIDSGVFNSIVTKALTADTIKVEIIEAMNSIVGQAVIDGALIQTGSIVDAQIVSLNANKIDAGEINTGKVTITGPDGHILIKDDTIRIYDEEDSEENRRLRVILGATKEITQDNNFGLVVLGADGSTRLYDNTGVYNAGIHENAVSNEKLQEDSVDARVIKAKSIFAEHIVANQILTEHLKAGSVTASKIVAGAITAGSAIIAEAAIADAQISELHGGKIIADTITAKQIKAGSITADKLNVGYQINLIKNGYDSFEQFSIGTKLGTIKSGAEASVVSKDMPYSGEKSFLLRGNSISNKIILDDNEFNLSSTVFPEEKYIISTYVYVDSSSSVAVKIGLNFPNAEFMSEDFFIEPNKYQRIYVEVEIPSATNRAAFILETKSTNTNVWFDCLQIEQKQENQTTPGWWRSTEITSIDGSMIKTGYVEAKRIKVGSGTVFGNGDIIEISDLGIKAKGTDGYAMLNSKGLEIIGGMFHLENEGKIAIDGKDGIIVESAKNRIIISADNGIKIIKKVNDEAMFYTTPEGEVYLKGRLEITESDTIYNKNEIDNSIQNIDNSIENIQTNLAQKLSISIGMKVGYQDFTTIHPKKIFFCGFKTNSNTYLEEIANVDGYIKNWENNNIIKIPKQNIDTTDVSSSSGYIVWDNTELTFWIICLNPDEKWVRFNKNNIKNNTLINLNESIYILGEVDF